MIARQLEIITNHKAKEELILTEQNLHFQKQANYIQKMDTKFQQLKDELSEVLKESVKE
jgi:hypothetical protein